MALSGPSARSAYTSAFDPKRILSRDSSASIQWMALKPRDKTAPTGLAREKLASHPVNHRGYGCHDECNAEDFRCEIFLLQHTG